MMNESGSDKTVVAFLIFPTRTNNYNVATLLGQVLAKSLRDTVHLVQQKFSLKMYEAFHGSGISENNKLLSQDDIIKRFLYASQ